MAMDCELAGRVGRFFQILSFWIKFEALQFVVQRESSDCFV